jgi:hypothetical protein
MRRRGHIIILIISPQPIIGLHQGLLADRVLDLHLWLASNTDDCLYNNLSERLAERETGIALIKGL